MVKGARGHRLPSSPSFIISAPAPGATPFNANQRHAAGKQQRASSAKRTARSSLLWCSYHSTSLSLSEITAPLTHQAKAVFICYSAAVLRKVVAGRDWKICARERAQGDFGPFENEDGRPSVLLTHEYELNSPEHAFHPTSDNVAEDRYTLSRMTPDASDAFAKMTPYTFRDLSHCFVHVWHHLV